MLTKRTILSIALICVLALYFSPLSGAAAKPLSQVTATPPSSHTFATFNTGTITGGAAPFSLALDTASLPDADYLFYMISADYIPGADPYAAWSQTLVMSMTNGTTTAYRPVGGATIGVLPGAGSTTLIWTGQFIRPYPGTTNLTIQFQDTFADTGGPYTSQLQNVTVTIYPGPTPSHTFATFNTGTITGGAAPFSLALDTASLPSADYLFYTVSANYVPSADPYAAWSDTLVMSMTNGTTTAYRPAGTATIGVLPGAGSTTLIWTGQFIRPYPGTTNLTIQFQDTFADAGGPYTSQLQNVTVTIYPAPTPSHTFATFNTGTITGGAAPFSLTLDTASLPDADYLFYMISADYIPGADPYAVWSQTLVMSMTNGTTTAYRPVGGANIGALPGAGSTTLIWTGQFVRPYPGTTNLTIQFQDTFTDSGGPYTSQLQNVTVMLYPAVSASTVWVASNCSSVSKPCSTSLAQAARDVAIGGRLIVMDTVANESVTIGKDLIMESGGSGSITGSGGAAAINVTGGTVYIQKLSIIRGTATNAVAVAGGVVTMRGNTLDGNGSAAIVRSGGTVTAYANNLTNTGGVGVSGSVSAPKNWWGTAVEANRPSGVSTGDWAVRLGADMVSVAYGEAGPVTLDSAQLIGPGPGTGVIIDFGTGSANAPFGVSVAPFGNQMCSDYYDFYSTGGAGWTVVLPINTGLAGCSTNALMARRAYLINDVSQCASTTDTACWDAIPIGQITINGNTLQISGLSLAGTHLVAGDSSSGSDPTAVQLKDLRGDSSAEPFPGGLLALASLMLSGFAVGLVIKRWRMKNAA